DRSLAAAIAPIPPARRLIVTDHDAFGYLAARYGIRIVGTVIPSLSTAAEPDARAITRLADTIRRNHVHAVFAEASVDPRVERAIAAEAGARLGGRLYGDSLGPAGRPAAPYAGVVGPDMAPGGGAGQGGRARPGVGAGRSWGVGGGGRSLGWVSCAAPGGGGGGAAGRTGGGRAPPCGAPRGVVRFPGRAPPAGRPAHAPRGAGARHDFPATA